MTVEIVEGDLLRQPVDVIVNSWNRNFIPHWLLIPQGVSGAIRRQAGSEPFRQIRKHGLLPVGAAILTGAGKLPYKGIIHVAGLNWWWTANRHSVQTSVRNAMRVFQENAFESIAFPLIGAGTGGMTPQGVEQLMTQELQQIQAPGKVILVHFRPLSRS